MKHPTYFTWSPLDANQTGNIPSSDDSILRYVERIISELSPQDKVIGIQIPEGLKPTVLKLVSQLKIDKPEIVTIVFFEPCYGSCDIIEGRHDSIDKIFHFGNSGMPDLNSKKTIFIEMYNESDGEEIEEVLDIAKSMGGPVGLLYNIQYRKNLLRLEQQLKAVDIDCMLGQGSKRIKYPGQLLGCNYSALTNIEMSVDWYILYTHGLFHLEVIPLVSQKKVLVVDLLNQTIKWISDIETNVLAARKSLMDECREAVEFGLLVSSKIGQDRLAEAYDMQRYLASHGKIGHLLMGDNLFSKYFTNIPIDAYINFGCPRVAINNSAKFDRPILTVSEVKSLINNEEYQYDTIE